MTNRDNPTAATIGDIIEAIGIIDGTNVGPADTTWQRVAGSLAEKLRFLASIVQGKAEGVDGYLTFDLPSMEDFEAAIRAQRDDGLQTAMRAYMQWVESCDPDMHAVGLERHAPALKDIIEEGKGDG